MRKDAVDCKIRISTIHSLKQRRERLSITPTSNFSQEIRQGLFFWSLVLLEIVQSSVRYAITLPRFTRALLARKDEGKEARDWSRFSAEQLAGAICAG
jgi:hypothetical protein